MLGFVDNFEQRFESCVLNTQNPFKKVLNKVNSLNTLKKSAYENFRWFPGFHICSMAKNENPETPEINRKLLNQKTPSVNALPLLENC